MIDDLKKIIKYHGEDKQKVKVMEEASELTQAIAKDLIGQTDMHNIVEEIADMSIMLEQAKIIYSISDRAVEDMVRYKVDRTLKRIEEEE